MLEFAKKRNYKKYIYSPVTFFLLLVILLVLLKALLGVYQKEQISAGYLQREREKLEGLAGRQKSLAQSVEYMKTEKGVEAEIRSKFRVVKEGESVAVIVDNETKVIPVASTTQKVGFWKKLGAWFRQLYSFSKEKAED